MINFVYNYFVGTGKSKFHRFRIKFLTMALLFIIFLSLIDKPKKGNKNTGDKFHARKCTDIK